MNASNGPTCQNSGCRKSATFQWSPLVDASVLVALCDAHREWAPSTSDTCAVVGCRKPCAAAAHISTVGRAAKGVAAPLCATHGDAVEDAMTPILAMTVGLSWLVARPPAQHVIA